MIFYGKQPAAMLHCRHQSAAAEQDDHLPGVVAKPQKGYLMMFKVLDFLLMLFCSGQC